jgi:photosystem II stability/assembly factor-like uncharacterized protein
MMKRFKNLIYFLLAWMFTSIFLGITCLYAFMADENIAVSIVFFPMLPLAAAVILWDEFEAIDTWVEQLGIVQRFALLIIILPVIILSYLAALAPASSTVTYLLAKEGGWVLEDTGIIAINCSDFSIASLIVTIVSSPLALAAQLHISIYSVPEGIDKLPMYLQALCISLTLGLGGLVEATLLAYMGWDYYRQIMVNQSLFLHKTKKAFRNAVYSVIRRLGTINYRDEWAQVFFLVLFISVIILGVLGLIFTAHPIPVEWEPIVTKGLPAGSSLFIKDFCLEPDGDSLFANTWGRGVLRSDDNGETWYAVGEGLGDNYIWASLVASDAALFVSKPDEGVFASYDNGQTWQLVNQGLSDLSINALIVKKDGNLLAGTEKGVFISPDGGENWRREGRRVSDLYVNALIWGPGKDSIFLGADEGLYCTEDDGQSWTPIPLGEDVKSVQALTIGPDGSALFAGTLSGLFRSVDGGETWYPANDELNSKSILALASGTDDQSLFAGTMAGVFYSSDGGESWQASSDLQDSIIWTLAVSPDKNRAFAGTLSGGWFSDDRGRSWSRIERGLTKLEVGALALDPGAEVMFAGTSGGGVFRSDDGGLTWIPHNHGLPNLHVKSLLMHSNTGKLLAGTLGGFFCSEDMGQTWQLIPLGKYEDPPVWSLIDFEKPRDFLFAATSYGVFRSEDGGENWRQCNKGLKISEIASIAAGPDGNSLFIGTDWSGRTSYRYGEWLTGKATFGVKNGIFRSDDWGNSWHRVLDDQIEARVYDFTVVPADDRLLAGTNKGILFSDDGGDEWQAVEQVESSMGSILALEVDSSKGVLYAATDGWGVFRSRDGGKTWQAVNKGLPDLTVNSLAWDEEGVLFAGTWGGIAYRDESTGTWKTINQGLSEVGEVKLAVGRNSANIYAELGGKGVFRSEDGGQSWRPFAQSLDEVEAVTMSSKARWLRFATPHTPQAISVQGDQATLYTSAGAAMILRAHMDLPFVWRLPVPYLALVSVSRQFLQVIRSNMISFIVGVGVIVLLTTSYTYMGIVRPNRMRFSTTFWLMAHPENLMSAVNYKGYIRRWRAGNALQRLILLLAPIEIFLIEELIDRLKQEGVAFDEDGLQIALTDLQQRGLLDQVKTDFLSQSMEEMSFKEMIRQIRYEVLLDRRGLSPYPSGLQQESDVTSSAWIVVDPLLTQTLRQDLSADVIARLASRTRREHPLCVSAQQFLQQAGFETELIEDSLFYRCEVRLPALRRILPSPTLYIRVFPSGVLDASSVLDIRDEMRQINPEARTVFVITDRRPADQGWAQIGTLRMEDFIILPLEETLLRKGLAEGRELPLLRQEIEKRLGEEYDPYDVRDPVAGAFSFFGRDALLEDLLRRTVDGRPVGIFGLRKLGKSSVLQVLSDHVPFPVAPVNLQTVGHTTLDELYLRILRYWQQQARVCYDLDWKSPTLYSDDVTGAFTSATLDLLDSIETKADDACLGLFLDEAELIVPRPDGSGPDLVSYLTLMRALRGLVDEDGRLSLIIASMNPSINRINAWDEEQNPTFNFFQEVYLPPLAQDGCIQMVRNIGRQVGLVYDDASVQAIADLSGGHPFLARQFCSLLYRQLDRQSGQIELGLIPSAIEHFIYDDQTVTHLDAGIWQDAGNISLWGKAQAQVNQEILLDLSRADEPLSEEAILDAPDVDTRRTALINLERFHFIHQPEPGYYALRYGLLRIWLRRRKLGLEGN